MKKLALTVLGVICGYALMVVLITLVQETWLGGVGWHESTLGVLALAGFLTFVAGALGAIAATAIARPASRVAAAIMAGLVVVETTALITTGKLAGPLWFDILAGASLAVAILVGAELFLRFAGRQAAPA